MLEAKREPIPGSLWKDPCQWAYGIIGSGEYNSDGILKIETHPQERVERTCGLSKI